MSIFLRTTLLAALAAYTAAAIAHDDHEHGAAGAGQHAEHDAHDEHGHAHDGTPDKVTINAAMAIASGIDTAPAGPGIIERHLQLYGRLVTAPDRRAQMRARFDGVITAVGVNVGDAVRKGDLLATVEADESLRSYALRAPIDGVVQSRNAGVGESTEGQVLFTLIDSRQLWAELKIFPGQRAQITVDQLLHIVHGDTVRDSRIASVTPASLNEPYVIARVVIDNSDGRFAAGDLVSGQVDVERVAVPLVVERRALQQIDGATVVFVRHGDEFSPRVLQLGRGDGRYSEVLDGLQSGENYVVQNSYLIKADLEKSGAAHEH